MEASARFEGDFRDLAFLKALLPDTALRRRVAIPATASGSRPAGADKAFSAASTPADGGELFPQGRLDTANRVTTPRSGPTASRSTVSSRPIRWGSSTWPCKPAARADPLLPRTRTSIRRRSAGRSSAAGFRERGAECKLEGQQLSGRLSDRDEALRLLLSVSGTLTEREQRIGLSGSVFGFDLAALGVSPEPISGSFALEAGASASTESAAIWPASRWTASKSGTNTGRTASARRARLQPDTTATWAKLASGDLSLAFVTLPVDLLFAALTRSARTLAGQIDAQSIDMEQLKPALPDFALRVSAGPDNILNSLLKSRKIAFDALNAEGANCDSLPVSIRLRRDWPAGTWSSTP